MILPVRMIKTNIKKNIHTLKPTLTDTLLNSSWPFVEDKWCNSVFRVISLCFMPLTLRKTIVKQIKNAKVQVFGLFKKSEYPSLYYIPNKNTMILYTMFFVGES